MALRSTIFKVDLSVADIDRGVYGDHALTLAQHPSETETRMMVRLLAFALFADPALSFGRGLSAEDEPDLWQRDATGTIELWIEIGCPEVRTLRKACGRARRVVVFATGERRTAVWWSEVGAELARSANLSVCTIDDASAAALAVHATRVMKLSATVQDNHALLAFETGTVEVAPQWLMR